MLQGEPFSFDHEMNPDIQQIMEFRPSETTVKGNYIDEYVVERLPARELTPSAELPHLLQEIKEIFFRQALDPENRTFMDLFPRIVQIQYDPHRYQTLNFYIKLINETISKEAVVQFIKTISILLADILSSITQLRIADTYKSVVIDKKQCIKDVSVNKEHIDTKNLEEHISRAQHINKGINSAKNNSRCGYENRKESSNPGIKNTILLASSNQCQTNVQNSSLKQEQKKCNRNQNFKPSHKESCRGGIGPKSRIIFQSVFSTKENREHKTNPESPPTRRICDRVTVYH
ncbi:hypothetical protein BB560_002579 [Smittium megazygosporum]|uniref:Uncharacterized protein n=1 Tax=Smittium megazygosporum TaxID=133381 RepID=A0A2T9ZEF0_9FUNG|nr:hypothetical protein BB560_002579 [Smittium megazygosporum]